MTQRSCHDLILTPCPVLSPTTPPCTRYFRNIIYTFQDNNNFLMPNASTCVIPMPSRTSSLGKLQEASKSKVQDYLKTSLTILSTYPRDQTSNTVITLYLKCSHNCLASKPSLRQELPLYLGTEHINVPKNINLNIINIIKYISPLNVIY